MIDKKDAELLKEKLFNNKRNAWNLKSSDEKEKIFEYSKNYIKLK